MSGVKFEEDYRTHAEWNRPAELAKTEWVEELRAQLIEWQRAVGDDYPDERLFVSSLVKDLRLLSHNLAVRDGADVRREYILFSDYHYENGNRARE